MSVISGARAPTIEEGSSNKSTINVGTRKSKLALVQTSLVISVAGGAFPNYKFVTQARDTAAGDIDKVTPFKDMAVKNIWTHELETLLMEGHLDILVHSLKGIPTMPRVGHRANLEQTVQHNFHKTVRLAASSLEEIHEMPS